MDMENICRSYWETFPLFPGTKITPPTGKGFVLPLVNISHFYLKRVSTPTLKLSPFPVGNVCPSLYYVHFQLPYKKISQNQLGNFSYFIWALSHPFSFHWEFKTILRLKYNSRKNAWIHKTGNSSQTGQNRETFPGWFIHEFWEIFTPGKAQCVKYSVKSAMCKVQCVKWNM